MINVSRSEHIRAAVDAAVAAAQAAAAAEWDAAREEWLATLPAGPHIGAYVSANGLPGPVEEGYWVGWAPAQHGTREEVEAAAAAWIANQQAAAAESERLAEEAARAREEAAAALEAAAATVQAAVASGKLDTPKVAEAYAAIALAGVARLRMPKIMPKI